jgi:hypothetical protein
MSWLQLSSDIEVLTFTRLVVITDVSRPTPAVSGRRPDVPFHVQSKPSAGGGPAHGFVGQRPFFTCSLLEVPHSV